MDTVRQSGHEQTGREYRRVVERGLTGQAIRTVPVKTAVPIQYEIQSGKSLKDAGVRELLQRLVHEKETNEKRTESKFGSKPWRWPWSIRMKAGQAAKKKESILVFYLNIKGEIEPMIVPIYGGNMVIIRNKIYEVDPRAIWTFKAGFKTYKVKIIKEIDRRPVSNLDLDEIRKRGDATDSDEFLIKAALKAQTIQIAKPMNKAVLIAIGIAAVALVIFLLVR